MLPSLSVQLRIWSGRNHDHGTLGEILGDKLSRLTPGNTIDEVGFLFAAVSAAEVTIDSHGKAGNGDAAAGTAKLGVTGQATMMTMWFSINYASTAVVRQRITPSVIFITRSSSAGNSGLLSKFIRT